MKRLTPFATLPLLLTLLLVGCDSAGSEENESEEDFALGAFRAEVTGAVTTSLEGVASFASSSDEGGEGFALVLAVLGPDGITLYRQQAGRPAVGTYEVTQLAEVLLGGKEQDFWGGIMLAQHRKFFVSESGTLTISSSSREDLTGTLEFEASDEEDGQRISVSASFRAQCTARAENDCT